MTELSQRLRFNADVCEKEETKTYAVAIWAKSMREAAETIERLTAEVAELQDDGVKTTLLLGEDKAKADALADAVLEAKYYTHGPGRDGERLDHIRIVDSTGIREKAIAYKGTENG